MHTGHTFARGLRKGLLKEPTSDGGPPPRIAYDAYMIEATAYAHATLTVRFPRWKHNREYDELRPVEQAEALAHHVSSEAVEFSNAMINGQRQPGIAEHAVMERFRFYRRHFDSPNAEPDILLGLVLALLDDDPGTRSGGLPGLGPGLWENLVATSYVSTWMTTILSGLHESAETMFRAPDELLAEMSP
jgi:hypothetical protein